MQRIRLFVILIVVALATMGNITPAPKSPVAAFDLAHREIFTPFKDRRLNYAIFYQMFVDAGFSPQLNTQTITPDYLKNVDAFVLFGPMYPLTDGEITALAQFVKRGGSLLVMLHIASPVAKLTSQFDILVSKQIVLEPTNKIVKVNDFYVTDLTRHPLNKDVKSLAVYGSWGVLAKKPSKSIALTSPQAWMEVNGNQQKDSYESSGKYGIVAINDQMGGKVIVIADDAPFLTDFIDNADNKTFARNVILWFKGELN